MPGVRAIDKDYLVCPVTINPALDRRFPMLNGGGRNVTGESGGVTYRSPWCRHAWRAEQWTSKQHSPEKVFFSCRGYNSEHELFDDFDCGYVEEGVYNLGVASVQVRNPAWGGIFIDEPSEAEWLKRDERLKKQPMTSWPEPDVDFVSRMPSLGLPDKGIPSPTPMPASAASSSKGGPSSASQSSQSVPTKAASAKKPIMQANVQSLSSKASHSG